MRHLQCWLWQMCWGPLVAPALAGERFCVYSGWEVRSWRRLGLDNKWVCISIKWFCVKFEDVEPPASLRFLRTIIYYFSFLRQLLLFNVIAVFFCFNICCICKYINPPTKSTGNIAPGRLFKTSSDGRRNLKDSGSRLFALGLARTIDVNESPPVVFFCKKTSRSFYNWKIFDCIVILDLIDVS